MDQYIEPVVKFAEEAGRVLRQIPEDTIRNTGVNLVTRLSTHCWTKLRGTTSAQCSDNDTKSSFNPINNESNHHEVLIQLRLAEIQVDSLRRSINRCECNTSKSCSVHCNHLYKLNQLAAIADRLTLLFAQLPLSNQKVQQHIDELWTCINSLGLTVAKYGEGIDVSEVLPLCYKVEKNDAFQQRFKDSIIGLENCLA